MPKKIIVRKKKYTTDTIAKPDIHVNGYCHAIISRLKNCESDTCYECPHYYDDWNVIKEKTNKLLTKIFFKK